MLLLVLAHRHVGRLIKQHVGGLQHRIGEQRRTCAFAVLAALVLELRHPVQPAHPGGPVEQPLHLGVRGHLRLVEQDRAFWIDPARHQRGRHFQRRALQLGRIVRHREGVQIGEEEQAFLTVSHRILHRHPVADRTEIIAEVEVAGGLDAGDDAHEGISLKDWMGPAEVLTRSGCAVFRRVRAIARPPAHAARSAPGPKG